MEYTARAKTPPTGEERTAFQEPMGRRGSTEAYWGGGLIMKLYRLNGGSDPLTGCYYSVNRAHLAHGKEPQTTGITGGNVGRRHAPR